MGLRGKQPNEFTKPIKNGAGIKAIINADVYRKALGYAGIKEGTKLKVKSYATRDRRGRAKIIIKLIPE